MTANFVRLVFKKSARTDQAFPKVDLSVPLMCCDPSDLGSLILNRTHPKIQVYLSDDVFQKEKVFHLDRSQGLS